MGYIRDMIRRKPSLWRAWSPVAFQVTGFLLVCTGPTLSPPHVGIPVAIAGAALWLFGFTYRK